MLPDAPTIEESGVKGFDAPNPFGFLAPRGTPAAIVAQLSAAMERVLAAPELRNALEQQGLEPQYLTPAAFTQQIEFNYATFERIIRSANVKVQ